MKRAAIETRIKAAVVLLAMAVTQRGLSQNSLMDFVPPGYTILDTAACDLDQDRLKDYILILKNDLEATLPDTTRPLLILHGKKGGGFELAGRNEHVVLCQACGGVFGNPYAGITVKKNFFSIEHYGGSGWRWTRVITFKYDPAAKQYLLHKDAGESFHISDPDKKESNLFHKEQWNKQPFEKYRLDP